MDKTKAERSAIRAAFSKQCNQIETLIAEKGYEDSEVNAKFLIIESKIKKLRTLDEDIFNVMLETNEEAGLEKEISVRDDYEERFLKLKLSIENNDRDKAEKLQTVVNESPRYKLPKIELKKYNGDLMEWLGFWSQFSKIHEDNSLAPEDKFQYLIQSTQDGSKAREVVLSFPPTGQNYPKVIESLKDRFGQEDMLVEVYIRELLKLVIKNVAKPLPIHTVYDKLESAMRALESLGITSEKCAPLLYPLVESSLSEDILRTYRRSVDADPTPTGRLEKLMKFIKTEVDAEQRISMAMDGFGFAKKDFRTRTNKLMKNEEIATASELFVQNETRSVCLFCSKAHSSSECFIAQKMSFEDKQKALRAKRACFSCLKVGHNSKRCKVKLKCIICSKHHVPLMCPMLSEKKGETKETVFNGITPEQNFSSLASFSRGPTVFLQTLKITVGGPLRRRTVRALVDTGSQRSYILKETASELGCVSLKQEVIIHSLFGGHKTNQRSHSCYGVELGNLDNSYVEKFEILDQPIICGIVNSVKRGPWMEEAKCLNIKITDIDDPPGPIEILIGADHAAKLLTGRQINLSCGLLAIETRLGWTLMGQVASNGETENLAMTVTSLFIQEASIADLWDLEAIGITDSVEKKSKEEEDFQTKMNFLNSVTMNEEGRYEVALPWKEEHLPLPSYENLALKRLENMTKKLHSENLYDVYDSTLTEWQNLGIIEEVPPEDVEALGCYLPHRPVIKHHGSTRVRPVFDASAREKSSPSLNQCLNCGPNLIELIPSLILRFREKEYGVSADIEKAFLQISVRPIDRNYLRFLWWTKDNKLKIFRHTRVVFGVNSSPYLLGAVIEFHLNKYSEDSRYDKELVKRLKDSFYVDNVVTSIETKEELFRFAEESKDIMGKGKFNLRDWQCTGEKDTSTILGLSWERSEDKLSLSLDWLDQFEIKCITKRKILSVTHKIFDPIGFACPALIFPKLLLQRLWKAEISWDSEINVESQKEFLDWFQDLHLLKNIAIPRWLHISSDEQKVSIHTFCDASKHAYATAVFIRVEVNETVEVCLLAAKSRVAPPKIITIPRLELIAALIGARLCATVLQGLNYSEREDIKFYFWTDSTTVLAWIQSDEIWSVFVSNRVKEIKSLTRPEFWRHVPGDINPADLPSRGCSIKNLVASRWWEGPYWLKNSPDDWPSSELIPDREAVLKEKRKTHSTGITCLINQSSVCDWCDTPKEENNELCKYHGLKWYYRYFSNYDKVVRMIGWVKRFIFNCRQPNIRKLGELSFEEFKEAEAKVIKLLQDETLTCDAERKLKSLNTFRDTQGIIRVKTKLTHREDTEDFRNPVLLPSNHPIVERLIMTAHKKNLHVGTQILLNILREQYWILNARRTIRRVISKCVTCKRQKGKHVTAAVAPLPAERVNDSAVFECVGIDLAGPLFLKGGTKAWICLFTCAVYRAVHLELLTAISTESFFQALRRFVARRGRPATIYCDNGTNFVGASNALKAIDWSEIAKRSISKRIEWRFIPPSAPWWGGWWERLIGILKQILRKVLAKAHLSFEELTTVLCDTESVINSRPLTYISEDDELVPLSPSLFLHDIRDNSVPDCDVVDEKSLNRRLRYRQKLMTDLRKRFRSEYLALLVQQRESKMHQYQISVGDVVLIGCDNVKRINWPLGMVNELIPGPDNVVRLVRLRTDNSELLRPVQRVFPLEVSSKSWAGAARDSTKVPKGQVPEKSVTKSIKCHPENDAGNAKQTWSHITRSGRTVKIPEKLNL